MKQFKQYNYGAMFCEDYEHQGNYALIDKFFGVVMDNNLFDWLE